MPPLFATTFRLLLKRSKLQRLLPQVLVNGSNPVMLIADALDLPAEWISLFPGYHPSTRR